MRIYLTSDDLGRPVLSKPVDDLAYELASLDGVSRALAREAVQAATEILEWRLGCAPPQRVFRLARAMTEHERKPPAQAWASSSERQGDLLEVRR